MKGQLVLLAAVFALVLYPVIQMDMPQAWAKGPGGRHGTTTGITQSGNTQTGSQALSGGSNPQGNPGASSSDNVQSKKKRPKLLDAATKGKVFKKVEIHGTASPSQ
jgi:hypothetical protein